jgi:hypothetical protein
MVARNIHIILIQFNLCLNLNELKIEEKSEVVVELSQVHELANAGAFSPWYISALVKIRNGAAECVGSL